MKCSLISWQNNKQMNLLQLHNRAIQTNVSGTNPWQVCPPFNQRENDSTDILLMDLGQELVKVV